MALTNCASRGHLILSSHCGPVGLAILRARTSHVDFSGCGSGCFLPGLRRQCGLRDRLRHSGLGSRFLGSPTPKLQIVNPLLPSLFWAVVVPGAYLEVFSHPAGRLGNSRSFGGSVLPCPIVQLYQFYLRELMPKAPPASWVRATVRTTCGLFSVSPDAAELTLALLKALNPSLTYQTHCFVGSYDKLEYGTYRDPTKKSSVWWNSFRKRGGCGAH